MVVALVGDVTPAFMPQATLAPKSTALRAFDDSARGDSVGRRNALGKIGLAFALAPGALTFSGLPVWADVSDGNALPQGAAQFGRVVRAKSDMLVSSNEKNWECMDGI